LQALTSLNEVLFMECAQALAARALAHAATDEERIRYAFAAAGAHPTLTIEDCSIC
jgi:hypothetical protein